MLERQILVANQVAQGFAKVLVLALARMDVQELAQTDAQGAAESAVHRA